MSGTSHAPSTASTHLSAKSAHNYHPIASASTSASGATYNRAASSSSWSAIDSGSEDDETGNDTQEYVLAMHDFAPQQNNVTCLTFRAGQVIHVINRDASGWWDGELDGRRGWFPSNYVTSEVGLLTEEELPKGTFVSVFGSAGCPGRKGC
ncbi:SH3 domain-containing protein [Trametes maxima]|nr:SH3 domain-containing protein [Trametes maxima]